MKKECKRGLAVFLSCLLILSQGAFSYAATVEKNIWATFVGEEPDYESIALYDATDVSGNEEAEAASKTMFAKLISGESYTATDSTPLFINNASVDASAYPEIDYHLAGDSSINLGSITVSSSVAKFPALTDYEASTVLSTYSNESVYDWNNPYSFTVTDNRTQSVFLKSDTLTVNESKTLSISYTKAGEEGPDNISVEAVNAVINGAVVLSGEGNGFIIEGDGSLTVGESGSITSLSETCFMEIREGSTVTGITLYDWDDGEGNFVAFETPSENAEVFSYLNIGSEDSPNMQWVKNGAGPGPGFTPGNFIVDYDNCPDPDDPETFRASVKVDDVIINPGEENAFTNETPIEFVLVSPEWRTDDTPVIEIVQHIADSEDIILRSNDDPATVILSSDRFTYTPDSTVVSFEVRIAWSEFDACGNGEDEYRIDVNIDDGISNVTLDKETITTIREHGDSGNFRFILSEADKLATLTVTLASGREIRTEDTNITLTSNSYLVSSSDYDDNRCANFDIRTNTFESNPIDDGYYRVFYNSWTDEESHVQGEVKVGGVHINSNTATAFTASTALAFTFTPPANRTETSDVPEVEITEYISHDRGDDRVKRSVDGDFSVSQAGFTYTPAADVLGFEVSINWNHFDTLNNGDDEYALNIHTDSQVSSVTLNKSDIANAFEHGTYGSRRFILSDANKEVTVTVTCSEGYEIDEENSTAGFSDGVLNVTASNYNADSRQFDIEIRTKASTPIVPPSPPSTGRDANFAGAKAAIEAVNFGYAGNATSIEEDLEWELWYMYFGYLKRANHDGDFYGMFGTVDKSVDTRSGLNSDNSRNPYTIDTDGPSDTFKNAVTLGSLTSTGSLVSGLSYYEFTIDFSLSPNWTGAEGVERYATGHVYALSNYTDIVVGFTNDSNVKDYKVVDASADAFTRTIVYGDYGTNGGVEVFGNGVYAVGATDRQGEGAYRYSSHITQEYSNLCERRSYRYEDGTGEHTALSGKPAISANLGIVNKCFKGFKAVGNNAKGTALAWGFGDWPLYWTNGSTDPSSCVFEMYKGNTKVTIESVDSEGIAVGIPSVTNVTCTLPYAAKAVSINSVTSGFEITLLSDYYDSIPLEVSYSDGTKGYATLRFVAIDIQVNRAGSGGSSIEIFHGNGETTHVDSAMVISGTYYYLNDQTTRIRLYCTITFDNGAVMKRVVSPYGALKDGSANGSNNYDDFLIYKVGDTSYNPIKVEVIAILPDHDGSFGGALIGSGFGVAKNVN